MHILKTAYNTTTVEPTPTIPTSFVPKQPVKTASRPQRSGGNIFFMISLILLAASLVGSGGIFAYERYLESARDAKDQQVRAAQERINPDTVEEFVRTRNRFTSASQILNGHVAPSQFFDTLEGLTLQSVRFDDLLFTLAEDRSAEIKVEGVARTFNALAAQSAAFASEKRIKSAIFSDITVNDDGTVGFSLVADLDPRLLILDPSRAPTATPSAMTLPEEEVETVEEVPAPPVENEPLPAL